MDFNQELNDFGQDIIKNYFDFNVIIKIGFSYRNYS